MRVLSLFSGIGAFEIALNELGIEWELDHYCEIDKYASQSYNYIHGTTDEDNLKDVTNIDYSKIGKVDLVTYGFPCQDISLAGRQRGFTTEEGELTRSGLFFNASNIIRQTKPKFAIFENVKNLTTKKFKNEFETILSTLNELGYNTYWQVLNAKDFGIPQNRSRVFGISIRKDIDKGFRFPRGFELKLTVKDMLEPVVDNCFYLSEKMIRWVGQLGTGNYKFTDGRINLDIARPLTTATSKRAGVSNYICTELPNNFNLISLLLESNTLQKEPKQRKLFETNKEDNDKLKNIYVNEISSLRVRHLTPREYWRLMGFKDEYFDKVIGISNTQLYKQAGNSIVVNVLKAIFTQLHRQYPEEFKLKEQGGES